MSEPKWRQAQRQVARSLLPDTSRADRPEDGPEPAWMALQRKHREYVRDGGYAADTGRMWRDNSMFVNYPDRLHMPQSMLDECEGFRWCQMTDFAPPHERALDADQVAAVRSLWTSQGVRDLIAAQPGFDPTERATAAHGLPTQQLNLPHFAVGDRLEGGPLAPLAPVVEAVVAANEFWWNFELVVVKPVMRRYTADKGHRVHADLGGHAPCAKLSASIQLSAAVVYEGGVLVARPGNVNLNPAGPPVPDSDAYRVPRDAGTIAIWPSWVLHEVEPVRSGTREALIVTFVGDRPLR
jgi:hypothetical protein